MPKRRSSLFHSRQGSTRGGSFLEPLESRTLLSAAPTYAYTMTDLGSLGGGFSASTGINAGGQVCGLSSNSAGAKYPVIFAGGKVTIVGPLGSSADAINDGGEVVGTSGGQLAIDAGGKTTLVAAPSGYTLWRVYGVNASGEICGDWKLANGHMHAFIYNPAKHAFTDLGTLGGSTASSVTDMSYASSINASGQTEGDSINAKGLDHAFIWTNGKMIDLGTFGGPDSSGDGMNDLGHAVGTAQLNIPCATDGVGYVSHLFFYNGTMHDYGTLGGDFANAYAINDKDKIVGWSDIKGDTAFHAFVCINGVMSDLNNLIQPGSGWTLNMAEGINNSGVIIVTGTNAAGQTNAFLLTPTAKPATPAPLSAMPPLPSSPSSGGGAQGSTGADTLLQSNFNVLAGAA